MCNGIVSIRDWLCLLCTVTAITGCSEAEKPAQHAPADRAEVAVPRWDLQGVNESAVLRVKEDTLRKRIWVLTLDEVQVYDTAGMTLRLIHTVVLPSWSVIGFRYVCMPDMVLDKTGSAFVSSNGQARLLRVHADSFDLQDYAIHFQGSAGRDNGLGALAFAPDGTLFARTTWDGFLWEIDITTATAIMPEYNPKTPSDECAITTQLLNPSARSPQ